MPIHHMPHSQKLVCFVAIVDLHPFLLIAQNVVDFVVRGDGEGFEVSWDSQVGVHAFREYLVLGRGDKRVIG